jgi:AraC-like DNA-binding protein/CheY-like chemotaxis protein
MARSTQTLRSGLRRILVVHDEPRMRTLVLRALAATNDVVETKEARGAITLMRSANHFDVVVVTCVGHEGRPRYGPRVGLIRNMFRQWPWIPVIVISRVQERARLIGEMLRSSVRLFLPSTVSAAGVRSAIRRATSRSRQGPPRAAGAGMKRIADFLGEHAGERFTLNELARMASMSRSHFSHMFHTILGMPLREYIRSLRLERAHHLLVSTPASLAAIAAETGFYDLPHFDKAFRQRVGMTPQGFRLRHNGRAPRTDRNAP